MKTIVIENCVDPNMPVGWNRAMHNALTEVALIERRHGKLVRRRVWSFVDVSGFRRYRVSAAPARQS